MDDWLTDFRNQSNFHVSCRNKGALLSLGVFIPNCWVQSFFEEKISNAPRAKSSFFGNGRNFFTFCDLKRELKRKRGRGRKWEQIFKTNIRSEMRELLKRWKLQSLSGTPGSLCPVNRPRLFTNLCNKVWKFDIYWDLWPQISILRGLKYKGPAYKLT